MKRKAGAWAAFLGLLGVPFGIWVMAYGLLDSRSWVYPLGVLVIVGSVTVTILGVVALVEDARRRARTNHRAH